MRPRDSSKTSLSWHFGVYIGSTPGTGTKGFLSYDGTLPTINVQVDPRRILIGDPPGSGVGLRLYVANVFSAGSVPGTVSVIDAEPGSPTIDTVIATITVGIHPRGMALTAAKDFLYVTNYDSFNMMKIDTATNQVVGGQSHSQTR